MNQNRQPQQNRQQFNQHKQNTISATNEFVFYAVLISIVLKTVSFIPLLHRAVDHQHTKNIPWAFLLSNLVASFLLIVVTGVKEMFPHMILFIIMFASIFILSVYKAKNDGDFMHFWDFYSPDTALQRRGVDIHKYKLVQRTTSTTESS